MDCIFCKIIAGEIPAYKVMESSEALAFLDIAPQTKGHTVVVPRVHTTNLLAIDDEKIGPLFEVVKATTAILNQALNPDGFTTGVNHGAVSGQTVDHLHVHIMPRFSGDGGGSIHSAVSNPPQASLEEIAEKVQKARLILHY